MDNDQQNIKNPLDPSDLRGMIYDSPNQFKVGFELAKNISIPGREFSHVVISGMGGSALPGNLLRIYLNDVYKKEGKRPIPIYQNRFYSLPPESYNNGLNILCSYSGNTEETIASLHEAIDNKLSCVGISAGGTIEEICKKNNLPHIKLPVPFPNFQPRVGTGYFFASVYQVLMNQGMVSDTTQTILDLANDLNSQMPQLEAEGKSLSQKLNGKTPVIYASTKLKALAMVWKIKFNEHAKTPAFWNFFPELNHNEMIGFTNPQGKFFVIMLRDANDHPKNLNRFEATTSLLKNKGVEVETINVEGETVFTKIFRTLALGDFAAYHLALSYNQDPTPVDMVEELKKILASMNS